MFSFFFFLNYTDSLEINIFFFCFVLFFDFLFQTILMFEDPSCPFILKAEELDWFIFLFVCLFIYFFPLDGSGIPLLFS